MRAANPNLPLLEPVLAALGPLCPRFVFVGGCGHGDFLASHDLEDGKGRESKCSVRYLQ